MLPSSLTVSVVTFRPDTVLLERCLRKLALAIGAAREDGCVRSVAVALIDNSEDRIVADEVIRLGKARFADSGIQVTYLHGHLNIGYGIAHNLMLHGTGADYQLVLNPDVEVASDAIANAVRWLDAHPDVGAAAPAVTRPDGTPDFLCKRYPAVFDLFLRGFAPRFVRRLFAGASTATSLRDYIDPASEKPVLGRAGDVGLLHARQAQGDRHHRRLRPEVFPLLRGFRLERALEQGHRRRRTCRRFAPCITAVTRRARACAHVGWFIQSGFRFYNKHGWRWF